MKKTLPEVQDVIYLGFWQGVGQMYNVKVEGGYATIVVKPGEDVKKRSLETKENFADKE